MWLQSMGNRLRHRTSSYYTTESRNNAVPSIVHVPANHPQVVFLPMDDPIDSAFQSRRFAHGKSKAKSGRGGGVSKPFNPSSAFGRYEVSLGAGTSTTQHALEIHELTECETGLLGTFDFAKLKGMFVLTGSRKQLAEIITGLEETDDNAEVDSEDNSGSDSDQPEHELSATELRDDKLNRRARAFEKNSFRNPKFWMKWKGKLEARIDGEPDQIESDMGYLVFANNACDKFEGTITCPSLDWKQVKLKGRKVHSNATSCPTTWNDINQ